MSGVQSSPYPKLIAPVYISTILSSKQGLTAEGFDIGTFVGIDSIIDFDRGCLFSLCLYILVIGKVIDVLGDTIKLEDETASISVAIR